MRAFALAPRTIAGAPVLHPGKHAAPAVARPIWIAAAFAVLFVALGAGAWWEDARDCDDARTGHRPHAGGHIGGNRARFNCSFAIHHAGWGRRRRLFRRRHREDIISALGRFRELTVISRGGVFAYEGREAEPGWWRAELKVRYVVEGSIRRTPDRVRVSVSLTDTARSVLVW